MQAVEVLRREVSDNAVFPLAIPGVNATAKKEGPSS
jgi:hypothetical protein